METKVEALKDDRASVSVTIDAADIDARIKKAYKDFANKYNFPGFRKGKAPRPIIDNALGAEAVRASVTDELVNGTYPLAIDEADVYPVSKPEFGESELVEAGKPYTYSFSVAVKPSFELKGYAPVEIELPPEGVGDAEIDEQVEALREHYYTLEEAPEQARVEADSYVDLSMKARDDKGEEIAVLAADSQVYGLGSNLLPVEFDEKIMGLKKGEGASFTIDVPADPPIMLASLADKTATIDFEVEIVNLKKKNKPEVSDEWVKDTLGLESVEGMRKQIGDTIARQKGDLLLRLKESACLDALAERLEGEAPAALCEDAEARLIQDFFQQLQSQGASFDAYLAQEGLNSAQFKEDVKKQALDTTKQDLALDAWARHFDLTVSAEDVSEEFAKSGVENPAALERQWRENGQLHMVRQGILRTKAVKDLMDKALVSEVDPEKLKERAGDKQGEGETAEKVGTPAASEAEQGAKKPTGKKAAPRKDAKEEAPEAGKAGKKKSDKPEKSEKSDKPDKPEKSDKPAKTAKKDKAADASAE